MEFNARSLSSLTRPWLIGNSFFLALFLVSNSTAQSEIEFTRSEISSIAAQGPWPVAVSNDPGNELSGKTWAEELGKVLFFDASLSANESISCASCHQPELGFSDNRPVAIGLKQGVRNTQGLLDVGHQRWFGWGGGADSLWAASIRPFLNEHEMGQSVASLATMLRQKPYLTSILNDQLNRSELNDEEIIAFAGKSIGAYLLTLNSTKTAFDRFRDALVTNDVNTQKDYPISAQRGLKIFIGEANCRVCHFGPNFSNGEFHDTGRPFFTGVGQVDPGRYAGITRVRTDPFNLLGQYSTGDDNTQLKTAAVRLGQVNWGQWRTPSLRNLRLTAPYMHDGSLETLRDVVDFYADIDTDRLHSKGESVLKPLDLNDAQRTDLVNFLQSLSAEN